jgi:hypothetical protein
MINKQVYLAVLLLFLTGGLCGQSILVVDPIIPPATTILSLNLVTCETTVLGANLNLPERPRGICQMPDTNIYILCRNPNNFNNSTLVFRYNPNTNALDNMLTVPAGTARAMIALNDSIIILHTSFALYEYNINQNTATFITSLSGSFEFRSLFFYNGQLYGQNESGFLFNIQYPSGVVTSVNHQTGLPITSVCNIIVLGNNTWPGGTGTLDWGNKSINPLCYNSYNVANQGVYATDPFNDTGPLCDCETEAGTSGNMPPIVCVPNSFNVPHNGNELLDGDDNLIYVLGYYDMSGPKFAYQVVHYYTQPILEFIPGVTEPGVWYYVFAIAGSALGDGVDFNDICLDAQFIRQIQWRAAPSVSFSAQNACPSGCQMVDVAFTGTGPYTLTYQVTAGATQQTFTQTFGNSTASIQVCPPPGYEGPVEVQATALVDAWCTCQ